MLSGGLSRAHVGEAILGQEIAAQKTDTSRIQETPAEEIGESHRQEAYLRDASTLSATALRKRYRSTYSSWTNMKTRCKQSGVPVDEAFVRFSDFLCEVGPRPDLNYTLDRIDPANPQYGPGLVRWLDKRGQANNRQVTLQLEVNGETKPLSIWASETNQKPDTLRRRLRAGWSHEEVVFGQRPKLSFNGNPWNYRPWRGGDNESDAEEYYQRYGARGEHPIVFAIRRFMEAMHPWIDFAMDNCRSQIDPQTLDECLRINEFLDRFDPVLSELRRRKMELWPLLNSKNKPIGWNGPHRFKISEERKTGA